MSHHLNTNRKEKLIHRLKKRFLTGLDEHGDEFNDWHRGPVYIVCEQLHVNVAPDAIHCPLLRHGW